MSTKLSHLLKALPNYHLNSNYGLDPVITKISTDSRQVEPGTLFVAYRGVNLDSHRFIPEVIAKGAAAIVCESANQRISESANQRISEWRMANSNPSFAIRHSPFTVHNSQFTIANSPLFIIVPNGREALAYLSAAWHNFPACRLKMVGITGTDGKTTTTNLLYHILQAHGQKVGMISTVNAVIGHQTLETGLHTTTPDAPDVQRYLAHMVEADTETCLLEVTSHALAHHRVTACEFDVAIVTNITHEHLDLHGSLDDYRAAKAMLFESLATAQDKGLPKTAILNCDDWSFEYLKAKLAQTGTAWLGYSLAGHPQAHLTAADVTYRPDKTCFTLCRGVAQSQWDDTDDENVIARPQGRSNPLHGVETASPAARSDMTAIFKGAHSFDVETNLVGDYNVSNCLAAALAALEVFQVAPVTVQQGIAALAGVPGRMERIDEGQPFMAMVDFAHTPNALRRSLAVARTLTGGRVIAVFGCAGLRDVEKRTMMGHFAAQLADYTIITAEDPRTEDLDAIIAETANTMLNDGAIEGETFERVPDRGRAIYRAVQLAGPRDLVIALGKGHEQSMCFGSVEYPWDDRQAMRSALRGQPLLTLPTAHSRGGVPMPPADA